jgi:hypothetical protein
VNEQQGAPGLKFHFADDAPAWNELEITAQGTKVRAVLNGVVITDYDGAALHPAESLWVVKGSFPTPMGGGLAAFLRRASADEVASATAGRVERLPRFAEPGATPDAAGRGR